MTEPTTTANATATVNATATATATATVTANANATANATVTATVTANANANANAGIPPRVAILPPPPLVPTSEGRSRLVDRRPLAGARCVRRFGVACGEEQ